MGLYDKFMHRKVYYFGVFDAFYEFFGFLLKAIKDLISEWNIELWDFKFLLEIPGFFIFFSLF
jgi:hypothetical protein